MAGLLTDSPPETFPTIIASGKSIYQDVEWSFTAAGLSGIYTRFPFNSIVETTTRNQFTTKVMEKKILTTQRDSFFSKESSYHSCLRQRIIDFLHKKSIFFQETVNKIRTTRVYLMCFS